MKNVTIPSKRGKGLLVRHAAKVCLAAGLAILIGISWDTAICRAQAPANDVPGAQVLTRGPVHEAFAGMVTFNPEPGVVVTKAPPAIIEEVPPEERPEGENVAWIPGYWAWDDERSDFLWVSGTWRALPPGRQWMAGYWGQTTQGYQWTSGYWADATAKETTYLPPPPATVEVGPNIAAPSLDYGWSPGCWIWYQGRYAWRPGYWAQGRADWDWCPAHYIWSPRGCIFVGGFWDYPVERRGVLFAPVYFETGVYSRRGYFYSPTIVIDLGVFTDHLFLRPRYQHYYFGDYYAASYSQGGFYASFSFQSGRYGYDPIYSHQRWEHRQDREWEHRVETSYQYRRDHETARPPRTWAAQRSINPGTPEFKQNRMLVATPMDQLTRRKDSPMRFQPVATVERQKLALRGQEVQKSREQRQTLEAKPVDMAARKAGGAFEPTKVQLPRSSIVGKPVNQLGRNQAPPKAPQAPKPDPKFQPRSETPARPPSVERSIPEVAPRQPVLEKKPAPGRSEAAPRERQVQPESQPRVQQIAPPSTSEKRVQPIVRSEVQPRENKTIPAREPVQVAKPAAAPRVAVAPIPQNTKTPSETRAPLRPPKEFKPEGHHPAPIRTSPAPRIAQQTDRQPKLVNPSERKVQQPAQERQNAPVKNGPNTAPKDHEKRGRE